VAYAGSSFNATAGPAGGIGGGPGGGFALGGAGGSAGGGAPGGIGSFAGGGSTTTTIEAWVRSACTTVPAGDYAAGAGQQSLYACSAGA
jgi:hypothetical protein